MKRLLFMEIWFKGLITIMCHGVHVSICIYVQNVKI